MAIAALMFVLVLLATFTIAQSLVTEDVVRETPVVLDGAVLAVEQVGQTIIVGGNFTRVEETRNGRVVDQAALFTYDADTGAFNTDFLPILSNNGGTVEVTDIEPAPDGRSVYISGNFLRINDRSDGVDRFRGRIAKIDLITGEVDRQFSLASPSAAPSSISYSNGWLYVGGSFTSVNDNSTGQTVTHELRGLARFDAETAAFDPRFLYETSGENIGRQVNNPADPNDERLFGVSDIDVSPNGISLVIAHRGSEFLDVTRNQAHQAGGVAIIALGNNPASHAVRPFQALYPDPADPIQEFYHAGQCNSRGVQIRDVEISPDSSYFITVGQGADNGFQCDSVVRWEMIGRPVRPTWVSRAFDSLFAVAVANDAIYIGGHHRYQVHPNAPSPYPGLVFANGESPPDRFEIYHADPNNTSAGGLAFREDLIDPGYVYPVGQIGAINPNTGFGIPRWRPSSNAQVGILDLTLTDRGLLLGQDNDRVNDIETGRSAFFDDLPGSGVIACSAQLDDSGRAQLTWNNTGSVDSFNVFQNGSFFATTSDSTFVDTQTASGTNFYELRFVRNGQNLTASCGSVALGAASLTCTATIDANNNVLIDWNDNRDWDRITVLRDTRWVTTQFGQDDYLDSPGPGTYNYTLRGFLQGTQINATCGTVTVDAAVVALTCSATVNANDNVVISWNGDVNWDRATILRDGRWVTTRSGVTRHTDPAGFGTFTYTARAFVDGVQFNADCGTITVDAGAGQCTAVVNGANITLSWSDQGVSSYLPRRDGAWIATVRNATTPQTRTFTTPFIAGDYAIRYWVAGVPHDIACT